MNKAIAKIAERVHGTDEDFEDETNKLKDEINRLNVIAANIKVFRNKAAVIQKELVLYAKDFIVTN